MTKRLVPILLIVILFLVIFLVGCSKATNKIVKDTQGEDMLKVEKRAEVVAIGDSITFGYPYGKPFSWVFNASKRLGVEIENRGEPGETTGQMLDRFEKDVLSIKPRYVIILGGTNDAFYNIPSATVRNNVYKMAELAEGQGIKPIIALPIPINEEPSNSILMEYRNWMKQFAESRDYQVIDFYSLFVDPRTGFIKQGYHEDGVHPSVLGYKLMSEIVEFQ